MMKLTTFLIIIFTCLLLNACQPQIAPDDYFPLQKGLIWHYQVSKTLTGKATTVSQYSVYNKGNVTLTEQYPDDDIAIRHTSDGSDYYILRDDVANYRVAKRTMVEQHPRFDATLRKIIPTAYGLTLNNTWSNNTQAYLIYAEPPHIMREDIGSNLSMLFQVTAIDETVTVPAGTFKHCIKIEGSAEFSFFADAAQGYKMVPITQYEWYAPSVGLIKFQRIEDINLPLFKGGKISYELTKFE